MRTCPRYTYYSHSQLRILTYLIITVVLFLLFTSIHPFSYCVRILSQVRSCAQEGMYDVRTRTLYVVTMFACDDNVHRLLYCRRFEWLQNDVVICTVHANSYRYMGIYDL